jgi:hypothetical protein
MKIKRWKRELSYKLGSILREMTSFKFIELNSHKDKSNVELVFYCGRKSIKYLNASLISVYNSWERLPHITIVSDGTIQKDLLSEIIKWPRGIEIVEWIDLTENLSDDFIGLIEFAKRNILGRKLIGILALSRKYDSILYSDTDVLWYSDPKLEDEVSKNNSAIEIKLGLDIEGDGYYSDDLINFVQFQISKPNLNSGIIFIRGNPMNLELWEKISLFFRMENEGKPAYENLTFHEQTAFVILSKFANTIPWGKDEILIQIDDILNFNFTRKDIKYPAIIARHYVTTKGWLYWKEYLLFFHWPLKRRFEIMKPK